MSQNTQEQNVQNNEVNTEKKKWEDYTLAEKKESYLRLVVKEIAEAIKNDYAPFTKEAKNLPRAYNGSNGLPYTNLNSLMLDIKQKQYGYEDNVWISLNDAKFLKATKEEIDSIFNNKNIPKAQVSYIKTFEIEFVYKLDKDGNKIPLLDENGNQRMNQNGKPLFEIATE
ncbi:ArdC-like ssDNA-binding domain-containing protein, partial [Helicobacter sp. faydin-H76]